MKKVLTTAIAGLMLLGVAAGVANSSTHQNKNAVIHSDGGPAPCYPDDPGCKPPIPIPSAR